MEKVSKLKTLKKDGIITAALSSQISDGASAVMIGKLCNQNALENITFLLAEKKNQCFKINNYEDF